MSQELRVACRTLGKNAGFTVVAVLTLALGIGATTAVYSVVQAVLLRPLGGDVTGRLVRVAERSRQVGPGVALPSIETYREWLKQAHSFESIAANQYCFLNLTGMGEPEQIGGPCSTANWFEVLGAKAMLGRTFFPDEDQQGREKVMVLEHGFWLRRFGGDPGAIGRTITLDKQSYLVIGVMPPEFQPLGRGNAPFFIPYVLNQHMETGVIVTGRLRTGVSLAQAQAELAVIDERLARTDPKHYAGRQTELIPILEERVGPHRKLLLLLLGSVALVLLIASANVANLFLARGMARNRELSIRIALGAARWRVVRLVLAEAAVIAIAGCAAGVALAWGGVKLLTWRLASVPRIEEVGVDWGVALFAAAAAVGTVLIFGLGPAIAITRIHPERALRSESITASAGRPSAIMRNSMVMAQVALAFVLLTGAVLLIRSFQLLRQVDLGYEPRQVLTGFLSMPESRDGSNTHGAVLFRRVRQRIATIPGVRDVGLASQLPTGGVIITMHVVPEGTDPEAPRPGEPEAHFSIVGGSYFRAMGIPLRSGRTLDDDDRNDRSPVLMVSESVEKRYFPTGATGRRIVIPEIRFNISDSGKRWITAEIVGVVGDVKRTSVNETGVMHVYLPEAQNAIRFAYLAVRTDGKPADLAAAVKHAVFEEAPDLPVAQPQSLEEKSAFLTDSPRQAMWLLSVFSALAVALAGVGVYGIMAYTAAQRRREIGIRMALGATPGQVVQMISAQSLRVIAAGLVAGIAGSLAATRLMEDLLYGVTRTDAASFGLAAAALIAAALLAGIAPARASASVDPASVLRAE